MEFLSQFGFNPALFVAQIVNFLILFIILKKLLYKPILKTVKDREKKISQGLKDAEKAHQELVAAEAERDKIIQKASQEAQSILDDTKKTADALKTSILEEARQDATRIIAHAKSQADSEMEKMRKEATGLSLEMSKRILDKVLLQLFDSKEQERIAQRGVDAITKYGKE